jgi:hypothetical protein
MVECVRGKQPLKEGDERGLKLCGVQRTIFTKEHAGSGMAVQCSAVR